MSEQIKCQKYQLSNGQTSLVFDIETGHAVNLHVHPTVSAKVGSYVSNLEANSFYIQKQSSVLEKSFPKAEVSGLVKAEPKSEVSGLVKAGSKVEVTPFGHKITFPNGATMEDVE